MYVTLLGPVAATVDGAPVALRGPRQRRLLAALAVDAGRVVPIERLVDAVWPTDPPATARRQIQDLVSSLRRTVDGLAAVPGGYRLDAAVDADEFRALVAAARAADPDAAGATLRRALGLWRGDALAGLDCPPLDPVRIALEEARLDATERRIDLDLAAGRAATLAGELAGLVAAHPTRERLVLQQMHALHASGRTADALDAYRRLRTRLADELGIDPGEEATRMYESILRADPRLAAHRPAQLPPDVAGFAGRVAESRLLDALTDRASALALVGPGGVGKTALALRWAHRAADRFPDGTLYANLRGWSASGPADPTAVLGQFLRALGLAPSGVPPTVDEASALFRTALADRRVLVVLDNAASAEQVRPLLPAGRSAAVVTSRAELAGLVARDGVRLVRLDVLPPADGLTVLRHAIGAARVDREPDAAARLVALCGGLPLALRIAAAHLAAAPDRPVAAYVAELGHGDRLAMLELIGDEENGLRAVFDRSFQAVSPDARRMFRLVGASPTVDVAVDAAAALAGRPEAEARDLCDRLVAANLAQYAGDRRVTLHDLLRVHAAHVIDPAELRAGVQRLLDFWLVRSDAAARRLYPARLRLPGAAAPAGPAGWTDEAALAWLDAEQENLITAIRYAAEHGPVDYSWRLIDAMRGYFGMRLDLTGAREAVRAALRTSADAGDLTAGCVLELCLADMSSMFDESDSEKHIRDAIRLAEMAGWAEGAAAGHTNLAATLMETSSLADAHRHLRTALEINERTGAPIDAVLVNLGLVETLRGRLDEAAGWLHRARSGVRVSGQQLTLAKTLVNLAAVEALRGRPDLAESHAADAIRRFGVLGERNGESEAWAVLAEIRRDAGRLDEALAHADAARDLARRSVYRHNVGYAATVRATVLARLGRDAEAADDLADALEVADGHTYTVDPHQVLAVLRLRAGDRAGARAHAERALAHAIAVDAPPLESAARATLADIDAASG